MQHKILVLFAVAGLLVCAFAGPRPDSVIRAMLRAGHHLDRDSIRALRAQLRGAVLPSGTDVNKVIQKARSGQIPVPPQKLGAGSYEGEFMPAPGIPGYPTVNTQDYPAVAFDGTKYLVVWEDDRDGHWHIYGALVSATGNPPTTGDGFAISPSSEAYYACYPSVAFDGSEFLVVWGDDRGYANEPSTDIDIYGALVDVSGETPVVTQLTYPISDAAGDQFQPRVAFNGTNYLVVWSDYRNGNYYDTYGALVNTDGEVLDPPGDNIAISVSEDYRPYPVSVAFGGTNYLVVWEDWRDDADIYGARVSNAGGVLDPDGFLVSTNTEETYQYLPSVAFDGDNYLVVWEDRTSGSDIYGARVSQAGLVQDPDGFEIATTTNSLQYPTVAFDGTEYLVAWMDVVPWPGVTYIYGRPASLGNVPGTMGKISYRESGLPALACGPVERTAMVAYHSITDVVGEKNYGGVNRIWGARATVTLNGTVDVGTARIVRPVASFLWDADPDNCWPIPPMARFVNNGTEPCSFNAEFTITNKDNEEVYTSTKTVLGLRPGYPRSVEFDRDSFHLATEGPGLYTGTCETELDGDGNEGNNSKSATFQGCNFINFSDLTDGDLTHTTDEGDHWAYDAPTCPPWTLPPMDKLTVWGDQVDGDYDDGENSLLTSPEYTAKKDYPAIAFQHSYNIDPYGGDGGNFSYTTDGGSSWWYPTPHNGPAYNGPVTVLDSKDGWYGNSSGWVQSVFILDKVTDTKTFNVRWRFASDGTNENLPGWLIDEVAGIGCSWIGGGDAPGHGSVIDTVSVWPNMVRGAAQVHYTLRKDCNVTINLYDASGRLAARVPTSGFKKGKNTARLDASGLARGVYFVKVKGETDTRTTKVIIE